MLYKKRTRPLDEALFQNPTSEYRGAPFWAWNCRLDREELLRQIEVLKSMGYGGFHMHVRTGMATEYLGDAYMQLVQACVEKARQEGMLAWLYDEDRWPSGAAGGIVTRNQDYRAHHLLLTRKPYGAHSPVEQLAQSQATSLRTENGILLACFDVYLNEDGSLNGYRKVEEQDAAGGFKLYAYLESAEPNPWFNNQTYVDTLNPAAVSEFIRVTYERYREYFAGDFGGMIPAIFTDEPQFSHKTTLGFAGEERDVILPWTPDLEDSFRKACPGMELTAHLPELLWEQPEGISRIRYLYHDHIAERFASAFADQCGAWCQEHGLMLTGHMMEEPTLGSQTAALGEAMRSYRSFQMPGIDMLCNRYEYTTAKQAQSACHQFGGPGVLSEIYGVTNWDFDFRGHKSQGDWQAALGVTVRVPHLSWVSMNGEAKRDYPATFNYQAPWHSQYALLEDYFARINTAMTRGKAVVRIGVIHPIESYWLHWGAAENTQAIREQQDGRFTELTGWLLEGLLDFDWIAESLLPAQCEPDRITGHGLPVGEMCYEAVVVPACETLRATTLERLELFCNAGGRVIFMGKAPVYQDAVINDRGLKLYERSQRIGFEKIALLEALEGLRELDIRDGSGGRAPELLYQMREECGDGVSEEGDSRWLFVAHGKAPVNKDVVDEERITLRIRGQWGCMRYDAMTGAITPVGSEAAGGWTALTFPFYAHDSLLLKMTREPATGRMRETEEVWTNVSAEPDSRRDVPAALVPKRWLGTVPVTLEEPNVLLLDMAEYRLDEGPWQEKEEILRIDNILRRELNWPQRMEAVAQPWAEQDESTPHRVTMRFTLTSRIAVRGAQLALERSDLAAICLNGAEVPVTVSGWYVDRCIHTIDLPELAAGSHVLELSYHYGRKVDLEYAYLLGDFSVTVAGTLAVLGEPVKELAFGDITRQGLPFYGGNLVYHLEVETGPETGALSVAASCYRGHLLGVAVDGEERGRIVFAPYRLKVQGLAPGKHTVGLRYFGSRVNTFGQLHCVVREEGFWWGPDAWRTTGEAWSYEYIFWPQGVLKSPEVTGRFI